MPFFRTRSKSRCRTPATQSCTTPVAQCTTPCGRPNCSCCPPQRISFATACCPQPRIIYPKVECVVPCQQPCPQPCPTTFCKIKNCCCKRETPNPKCKIANCCCRKKVDCTTGCVTEVCEPQPRPKCRSLSNCRETLWCKDIRNTGKCGIVDDCGRKVMNSACCKPGCSKVKPCMTCCKVGCVDLQVRCFTCRRVRCICN